MKILMALIGIAGLAAGMAASSAVAADNLLTSYVGNYSGAGAITGQQPLKLKCRMTLQPASAESINYTGRCSAEITTISFSGILTSSGGKYQASMTSSVGSSGAVAGRVRNGGVAFSTSGNANIQGKNLTVSSTMTFANGGINIEFSSKDEAGTASTGTIAFQKQQ